MSEQAIPASPGRFSFSRSFLLWVGLLLLLLLAGLVSGGAVLLQGLGQTNLTDQVPWGLWITLDLSSIALGAGAFTLSAAVYLLRMREYEQIARAAVLVGFLGYSSAMLSLFMDIGRPDRFYHPLIFWNVHSVLWEITWCVILYTSILVIEMLPVLFATPFFARWPFFARVGDFLHHRITPLAAVVGLGLSLLHQSSLGATYGVLTARPTWFKPTAPVLFILSAVAAGPALTVLVTLIVSRVRKQQIVSRQVINGVARFVGFVLLAYLYLKLWDWAATTYYSHVPQRVVALETLSENTPFGAAFWWGEIIIGTLIPAVILLRRRWRSNDRLLALAAVLIIAGLVINRWNTTLSGLTVPLQWSPGVAYAAPINTYTPAITEWGVALGIIAYAFLGFTLAARFLPVYPEAEQT